MGVQCHPEFKSKPTQPHPLFRDFIGASLEQRRAKKARSDGVPANGGDGRLKRRERPRRCPPGLRRSSTTSSSSGSTSNSAASLQSSAPLISIGSPKRPLRAAPEPVLVPVDDAVLAGRGVLDLELPVRVRHRVVRVVEDAHVARSSTPWIVHLYWIGGLSGDKRLRHLPLVHLAAWSRCTRRCCRWSRRSCAATGAEFFTTIVSPTRATVTRLTNMQHGWSMTHLGGLPLRVVRVDLVLAANLAFGSFVVRPQPDDHVLDARGSSGSRSPIRRGSSPFERQWSLSWVTFSSSAWGCPSRPGTRPGP